MNFEQLIPEREAGFSSSARIQRRPTGSSGGIRLNPTAAHELNVYTREKAKRIGNGSQHTHTHISTNNAHTHKQKHIQTTTLPPHQNKKQKIEKI